MRPRHCKRSEAICLGLLLFIALLAYSTMARSESLRGDYSFGHEVNIFCPENTSQCYWLGPKSRQEARERLKRIYREKKPELYHPVCVVLEGEIDRESPRDGFAADYDGLINVNRVDGACSASGEKSITEAGATPCHDPRPQVCTADYRPVCATLQGGGTKTYSNGCNACGDANVEAWVENACPE